MNNTEGVRQRAIQKIVQKSVLWEQVSKTAGDPNKYFLYFADKQSRLDAILALGKLFPNASVNIASEESEADIRYSRDIKGEEEYPTIKIPVEVADSLREDYKENKRLVNASPAHGGVRLSTTYPGQHAQSVLQKLARPIGLPR